ncbi:MAG: hypothetical protein ABSB80_00325 [Methanoregula sp.]|jgi:hypothetical protein|uniref:hypothetical protein n=1 Tax=Methanoregula sp. TaxID=2052170 RepID=UPI003D09751A
MNLTDRRTWEKILVAVCCAIIISWIALFVISPGHRIVVGTCGPDTMPMYYSVDIQPEFASGFLYEFGKREPDKDLTLPPMKRYAEKQQIIDTLMDRAGITAAPDSVIGLYEFPDARILLASRDTGMVEVLGTGDRIQTHNLTPVPVGSRRYGINETVNPVQRGAYNFTSDYFVTIDRVDLVLPPPGNATTPLYIVYKTDVDQIFYPDGRPLASITTRGTFYVLYGQQIERVIGMSEIKLDPGWKQCSPRMDVSGEGSRLGDIQHTVKLARSSERILWSRLIVTSADIQQYDTGEESTSQWMSTDNTGCSC